jgi:O-succinylbenzoic acid--CoA ligase
LAENLKPQNDFEKKVENFLAEWFSDSETLRCRLPVQQGFRKNSRLKNPEC